jgi:hypothetical protein
VPVRLEDVEEVVEELEVRVAQLPGEKVAAWRTEDVGAHGRLQ